MPTEIKYPDIEVQLTGHDSDAFMIIGRVCKALRKAGLTDADVSTFSEEATSGDYDNVLQTAMRWVSVS